MKYTILLCLLALSACNIRIYTNGKFSHKEKGLTSHWHSDFDSCFVLEARDSIPPGAIYVNDTKLLSPEVWLTLHPNEIVYARLKDEARRVGANLIKITDRRESKLTRLAVDTKLYKIAGQALVNYHHQLDSIARVNSNYAIIHIQSYAYRWQKPATLFYNDSQVGTCQAPTRRKTARGWEIHELNLRFSSPGTLSINNWEHLTHSPHHLELGHVYNFIILSGKYGDYLYPLKDPSP